MLSPADITKYSKKSTQGRKAHWARGCRGPGSRPLGSIASGHVVKQIIAGRVKSQRCTGGRGREGGERGKREGGEGTEETERRKEGLGITHTSGYLPFLPGFTPKFLPPPNTPPKNEPTMDQFISKVGTLITQFPPKCPTFENGCTQRPVPFHETLGDILDPNPCAHGSLVWSH